MRSVSTVCAVSFLSGLESRTSSSQSRPRHLFSDAINLPPHTSAISPLPLLHGVFQVDDDHIDVSIHHPNVSSSLHPKVEFITLHYGPPIVEGDSIFHNKPPLLKGTPSYSKSYWSPPPPLPKGRGEREMMSEAERDAFAKLSDEEVIAEHEKLFPPGKPMHPRENGRPVHMGMIDELSEVVEAQDGEVLALEKEVNNEKRVVILFNYVTPQI
ncbi:hypothetical protein TIFTF001_044889 [Ficus carica]|uniref:Uncharacterized protein n=1 Tax=Ficus carica TaxID=3494 RepID=A0AA87ZYT4_FICCA|nr:hypothetical protein TIFTF001_044889 [Ficus carica]